MIEYAVYAVAYPEFISLRLKVNIAGAGLDGCLDKALQQFQILFVRTCLFALGGIFAHSVTFDEVSVSCSLKCQMARLGMDLTPAVAAQLAADCRV